MRGFRSIAMALVVAVQFNAAAHAVEAPKPTRELIFGSELMTDSELDRYRAEISRVPDAAAQDAYRARHRERLRVRARDRGEKLIEPQGIVDHGTGGR